MALHLYIFINWAKVVKQPGRVYNGIFNTYFCLSLTFLTQYDKSLVNISVLDRHQYFDDSAFLASSFSHPWHAMLLLHTPCFMPNVEIYL